MDPIVAKNALSARQLEAAARFGKRDVKIEYGIRGMILKQNNVSVFLCGANRIEIGVAAYRGVGEAEKLLQLVASCIGAIQRGSFAHEKRVKVENEEILIFKACNSTCIKSAFYGRSVFEDQIKYLLRVSKEQEEERKYTDEG